MKLLIASTYFTPYSSGLSVYAHRLAKGLAALGHEVVVLTSQYQKELPSEETMEGFRVIRVPVRGRISKGVLMPGLLKAAHKWITWADAVNLHLPQFEYLLDRHRSEIASKTTLSNLPLRSANTRQFDKSLGWLGDANIRRLGSKNGRQHRSKFAGLRGKFALAEAAHRKNPGSSYPRGINKSRRGACTRVKEPLWNQS